MIPWQYIRNPEQAKKDFKNLSPLLKSALVVIVLFFLAVLVGTIMK